jgi:hypothetical protein
MSMERRFVMQPTEVMEDWKWERIHSLDLKRFMK